MRAPTCGLCSGRRLAAPVATADTKAEDRDSSRTVELMGGPVGRGTRQRRLGSRFSGLPRRRRILGIAVMAIVVAGAAGIAVAVSRGSQSGQEGGAGPARQAAPAQARPGPVLLVPGYGGSTGSLDWLAGRIRATGRAATVVTLPGAGTGSLVADAAALNAAVNDALAHGAPSVDVIGYSAGGVVALIWARRDDGIARARRIITLGAPFHGTSLAAAAQAFVPGACPVACQQLIPGSPLLGSLDVAHTAGLPRWLSLWTTDDQVVTPPTSARLPGAIDVPVQSVCPSVSISHSQLPTSPYVTAMVLQALGTSPLRKPTAALCR
jgi:triacylglycerol lipase